MAERKIRRNLLQCRLCGDIVESKHTHDYVHCKCGKCAVDGGRDYIRVTAPSEEAFVLLTEYEGDPVSQA